MRLIDADLLKGRFIHGRFDDVYISEKEVQDAPTIDAVEIVRCKECKHRPKYDGPNRLVFPDEICPCQCDDLYYNWMPSDDYFCADGERKE